MADIPTGIETDPNPTDAPNPDGAGRVLALPQHTRLIQVELADQTDHFNELVQERQWLLHPAQKLRLSGCLFVAESTVGDSAARGLGWVMLKAAPLPHARTRPSDVDLSVERSADGFLATLHEADGYAWHVLEYVGGEIGRAEALQRLQRDARPGLPVWFLTNTWGDRSRDSRVTEAFLLEEIAAAARLGADLVQIDDGWQRGRSANSAEAAGRGGGAWEGFYGADAEFWSPDPQRFPNGLEPVAAAARQAGVKLGLWFALDSSNDFANWRKDADTLLGLHRQHGVLAFKLDSIHLRSPAGEENLRRLVRAVMEGSGGRIVLDLDVTALTRPGYFGIMEAGPVFVENRYTDWHNYWPHQTLRNLWSLARWVDPRRLRMEFLNHARNTDAYAHDPLAPAVYEPAYLLATVLFSQPLGWFEATNLPEAYFGQIPPLVEAWKRCREAVFDGTIVPIGDRPDGTAWTGFLSVAPDRRSGYVLLLRETNERPEATLPLPTGLAVTGSEIAFASTGCEITPAGADLRVCLDRPRSFVLARVQFAPPTTASPGK